MHVGVHHAGQEYFVAGQDDGARGGQVGVVGLDGGDAATGYRDGGGLFTGRQDRAVRAEDEFVFAHGRFTSL